MLAIVAIGLLASGERGLSGQSAGLTIERINALPSFTGTAPSQATWSPDSSHLAFLWNDSGWPFRDIWVVPAGGGQPTRITDLNRTHPAPEGTDPDPVGSLALRAAARARPGVSSFVWAPGGTALAFLYRGDIFRVNADGSALERLTRTGGSKSNLAYAPDGAFLSFLQGGDLWLWHLGLKESPPIRATRMAEPSATGDGSQDVEFSDYSWAPDSSRIVLHFNDRRHVRLVPFPSYLSGDEPVLSLQRRPYPGDVDWVRKLGVYGISDGRVQFLDMPDSLGRNFLDYEWSPDGRHLLIQQDSDEGEERWLYVADAHDRSVVELLHDRRARRIYPAFRAIWQSDGKGIIFISDHEEWYRLYSLPVSGGSPRALTPAGFDVASNRGASTLVVSPGSREVFFVSTQKSPYERQVYRMPEAGGAITPVTAMEGVHDFSLSPDGARVATVHSSDLAPPALYLLDAQGGTEQRITHAGPEEFHKYPWVKPRYVTFKSRIDNFTLHARIIEPPDLDRTKKYPVVLGPVYSNTVRNSWAGARNTYAQMEALAGKYINVQVDLRGSIGYGVAFREAFQGDWGGGDLEDLHSAVEYLQTLPYVDQDRIGVWGSSYGGMMAMFALFNKPDVFKVGVAGAPAVDVAYFTSFDQHLSRRPHTHPETFRNSNLLNYGEDLEGKLLFIHGMRDTTVPFRTTVRMMEKLMLLGKDFDIAFAPNAPHGWSSSEHYAVFLNRKLQQYFDLHLGAGPRDVPVTRAR